MIGPRAQTKAPTMSKYRSQAFRTMSFALCFGLLNMAVPYGAICVLGKPIGDAIVQRATIATRDREEIAKRRAVSHTRLLTAKEETQLQGSAGENPYLAGQNKWDVNYKGVDLMTGNFSTSATDLSFEGGYGIPVNVTRSYSANCVDEGPFGKGWALSADVRSTAGGLLKSKSGTVHAVPTSFKDRPHLQLDDPNAESPLGVLRQPVEAVVATDAGGKEETVQRDVDGVLTPPHGTRTRTTPNTSS